ncbi:MAG: T9SS type A sorting domain-containing protein [Bacteroidales bacterium]
MTKVTDKADNFKVYPNPTKGSFVLIGEPVTEQLHLVIYNNIGQIVWQSKQFFSGKINISLENFPKGVYLLKISNGKQLKTIKIMKI